MGDISSSVVDDSVSALFSFLRTQCYRELNSSVSGLMGFLKGYKLFQLANRGHFPANSHVSENIINASTHVRPITVSVGSQRVTG